MYTITGYMNIAIHELLVLSVKQQKYIRQCIDLTCILEALGKPHTSIDTALCACLPFLFVFSMGLPLMCIILNANQRTKTGEAWDRGYKPQTSTVSVTDKLFSCVCGCLATSTPSNDISIKQEDVKYS